MKYKLEFSTRAVKELRKLDNYTRQIVTTWLEKKISGTENPRNHGKALIGKFSGYWRYRVGNWRIVVKIVGNKAIVHAITIGHRNSYPHGGRSRVCK